MPGCEELDVRSFDDRPCWDSLEVLASARLCWCGWRLGAAPEADLGMDSLVCGLLDSRALTSGLADGALSLLLLTLGPGSCEWAEAASEVGSECPTHEGCDFLFPLPLAVKLLSELTSEVTFSDFIAGSLRLFGGKFSLVGPSPEFWAGWALDCALLLESTFEIFPFWAASVQADRSDFFEASLSLFAFWSCQATWEYFAFEFVGLSSV